MAIGKAAVRSARPARLRIDVRGVVQGVGFRPFVYRLAAAHRLAGWVRNTSGNVEIEVEGEHNAVDAFVRDLRECAPPLARIESINVAKRAARGYTAFRIDASEPQEGKYQLVSPDIATCPDCLREVFDPADRRYRYPFTNCTNCGPRFTIIEDIPYDRPLTTMRRFAMCPQCRGEYEDPLDRRFHAQPNACPACGPRLELVDATGKPVARADPLTEAAALLRAGRIVAVKGLGGFLLACDATSEQAVRRLRERKRRPFKPLAIMVATIDDATRRCLVSAKEESLLLSAPSPIVLLRMRQEDTDIAPAVAPGLKHLGVMLPYTPLHHLLMREAGRPLVMTSGNISEEPIAKDNEEALGTLGAIADCFLMHDRDIHSRYDDSVFIVEGGRARTVRRARGYAPYPVRLPFETGQILACGAELKSTFCLTKERYAFVSQHIGDLENVETMEHFEETLALYRRLFRITPAAVAYDLHPEYLSTKYAGQLRERMDAGVPFVGVQHHHAHIAACLAENGETGPAIGVALDGTGYGTDGRIWGGEFLVVDGASFRRWGHLEYVPMPGGATAIQRPYRMALAYLHALLGPDASLEGLPLLQAVPGEERDIVRRQIERGVNAPLTSSCGRLFDAVAVLAGIRGEVDYEAQAAVELEAAAPDETPADGPSYPFFFEDTPDWRVVRLRTLIKAVLADARAGVSTSEISARFHRTVARLILACTEAMSAETGLRTVALSGGVLQNRLLFRLATVLLERAGFRVLTHSVVPCNDGGISLGQAVVAHYLTSGGR